MPGIINKTKTVTPCNDYTMSWLCCNNPPRPSSLYSQPLKFKILRNLNLYPSILNLFVLPGKKQPYTFPRNRLMFLSYNDTNHIPIVYFPSNVEKDILIIYCHGSGSNLNNVYNFGGNIMNRYGVSVLLYDYTGDGESNKEFVSYQSDLKVVIAWAIAQGYELDHIMLCGYSIGSYSALLLQGPMPRILISPICGIIPFIQGTNNQYQGQTFDNLENAQKLQSRTLILHGAKQMIPYSHAQAIVDSLRTKNRPQTIQLLKVEGISHLDMPNTLLNKQAEPIINSFIDKVKEDAHKNKYMNAHGNRLWEELKKIGIKIAVQRSIKSQ